jgi:hypothetical protein
VSDPLITFAEFGSQIHRSARTAQRIAERDGLSVYQINYSKLLRQSDVTAWIEARRTDPGEQVGSLKELVARAVQRAKEKRAS